MLTRPHHAPMMPGMTSPLIRLGLPLVGGQLPSAARALGAATLVSANALGVYGGPDRDFVRFRTCPDLDGMDVALDSAGFVAWAHYGDYPWTVEAYVALAASRPWTWWASMDACCEPEVAGSRDVVRLRQAETIRLLNECRRVARDLGCSAPMPVLQGWRASDYVWHASQIDLEGATLVGVGSMCRRNVWGPDGLVAVVAALDAVLPAGVQLHLFGVKSDGLEVLARHPRVASIDSMAWDVEARRVGREGDGCTMAVRTAAMRRWYTSQVARVSSSSGVPGVLGLFDGEDDGVSEEGASWADLVADGEIEAHSAAIYMAREFGG